MWPRDSLAQKLSDGGYRALITTYGYRSSLQDTLNNATFDDYANDWLDGSILIHQRLSQVSDELLREATYYIYPGRWLTSTVWTTETGISRGF